MSDDETVTFRERDGSTRQVRVLDLLDPRAPRAGKEQRAARMDTCHGCPQLGFGARCGVCGCAMRLKTWLLDATCPLGRWKEGGAA